MRYSAFTVACVLCTALTIPQPALSQYTPSEEEVATPEAIVACLYDTFQRKPASP